MKVIPTAIEGVIIIEPQVFKDERGYFKETYHFPRFETHQIKQRFLQDNLSYSIQNTLRGLHFQIKYPQAKLVQPVVGEIFDVVVDIRPQSKTYGQWVGVVLSENNHRQLFVPEGLAHGFCVTSTVAYVSYKCSDVYHPNDEGGLLWSDPDLNIDWPVTNPLISDKDLKNPLLKDIKTQFNL